MTDSVLNDIKLIPGWGNYWHIFSTAVDYFPPQSTLIEVGVLFGKMTIWMAYVNQLSGKGHKIFGVDLFQHGRNDWKGGHPHDDPPEIDGLTIRQSMDHYIDKFKVDLTVLTLDSTESSQRFEDDSVDFVWIDGDHSYAKVKADIEAWWPKIKQGGIMAGDDYTHFPEIKKAVHEVFDPQQIVDVAENTQWWLIQRSSDLGFRVRSKFLHAHP